MCKKSGYIFLLGLFIFLLGGIIFYDLTPKKGIIKDGDILVVLTGGKGRIPIAVELLKSNPHNALFISGVGASQIADVVGNPDLLKRIGYEQNAKTTRENSFEVNQ